MFTSESVTEGHPDKMCDQISDAVLDAIYTDDPMGRVACETAVTTGLVLVAGEITTETYVDIPGLVRKTIAGIGYDRAKYGFDCETCGIITAIDQQSTDISGGVTHSEEEREGEASDPYDKLGAGDQGMMFGYACTDTEELMPAPIWLAHRLARRLTDVRKAEILPYLRPDGKTQVTMKYVDGKPVAVDTILISSQHAPSVDIKGLMEPDFIEHVVRPIVPEEWIDYKTVKIYVNPSGRFVYGGPMADTGLTGRKIIVDTYGGMARHGGGAFSGKDPTKVDRSAAYMARYVAKNVVAAGLAERCELELAYAIGRAHPLSVMVETFGTNTVDEEKIEALIREHFDMRPGAIIDKLELRRPVYQRTAAYGHFGRHEDGFTWEKTDMAEALKKAAGV
jgi:S-adenosylmethionine synthetase